MKSDRQVIFMKKIEIIRMLYETYGYNYIEISYILDEYPEVIETYFEVFISSDKIKNSNLELTQGDDKNGF